MDNIEPTIASTELQSSESVQLMNVHSSVDLSREETSKDILSGDKGVKFVDLLYENVALGDFIPFYGLWPTDFFSKNKNYIGIFYFQQSYYLTVEEKNDLDDMTKTVTIIGDEKKVTKAIENSIIQALDPLSSHFETNTKYFIVVNFKKIPNKFGVFDTDFFYSLLQIASWVVKGLDLDAIVDAYKYWTIDSIFQNFNLK